MTKNKLITVIGNVGSGKSTLTRLLAKKLSATIVPADELYKINPFFPLAVKDRKRWSLASDLWFLRERVNLAKKYPQYLLKKNVVVDSGIPMSWVYANSRLKSGFFTRDEWNLYKNYYRVATANIRPPDIVIFLKAKVPFLMERIRKRGRSFEIKYFDQKYLASLEQSIEGFMKIQDRKTKIYKLKAGISIDIDQLLK